MRIFAFLDGDVPCIKVPGFTIRLTNKEFDSLFYDMKMVARNAN